MNALQVAGRSVDVSASQWAMQKEQAGMLVKTGFLPSAINTPEKAIAVMMKGRELGIPPMYALSNIAVIQGKPSANAELMLALIYRDHGDDAIQFTEASNVRATISYKRRHWRERRDFTFSLDDARTAGLTDGNWRKYPAAMLRARCISAVARLAFPDTIGGLYTPEELGASVDQETGEIGCEADAAPTPRMPALAAPLPAPVPAVDLPQDIDGDFVTALSAGAAPAGDPDPDYEAAVDRYRLAWQALDDLGRPPTKWPREPGYDLTTEQLHARAQKLEAAAQEGR